MDAILYELNLLRLTLEITTVVLAVGMSAFFVLGVACLLVYQDRE